MGLRRHAKVPLKQRLRVSFWASVGVPAVLLFAATAVTLWKNGDEVRAELDEGGDISRRLDSGNSMYPHDYLLGCDVGECSSSVRRGLVFVHVVGIGYMLLGLNTVCDVYFTGALEVMVDVWKIKPDVAGATFMAAGGSAPELFTSLIGATIAINDVGFGTIVGSAVFNVLFVIGLCGFAAPDGIPLTWWPLFRDCTYYIAGLGLLAYCASDQLISLLEAIILFCAYIGYCTIMWHNARIEGCVMRMGKGGKSSAQVTPEELYKSEDQSLPATTSSGANPTAYGKLDEPDEAQQKPAGSETTPEATPEVAAEDLKEKQDGDAEDGDDDDDECFMKKPEGGFDQILYYLSLPVYVPLYYLTPEASEKMFVATFLISLMWIAGFSFLLVWWVEIVADILGIPTIIAGFTVLAAGTSIPDLASSVAVARKGEGDMAVSSSIGSNIFDILVGLPIPWIIKTGLIEGGDYKVVILSPYLTFYVLLLLLMVFLTVLSIHMLGWTLNKPLGGCMALLYLVFLVTAVSVEEAKPQAMKF